MEFGTGNAHEMADRITMNHDAVLALALSRRIQPALRGLEPRITGACLADLVSLFIAAYKPADRDRVIGDWLADMRALVEPSERELAERPAPGRQP
jgi:hypothetical protein